MNKEEKIDFINSMIDTVKENILEKVDKMPERWNGTELRFYIKDCFIDIVWSDRKDRKSKQYGDYVNVYHMNDL